MPWCQVRPECQMYYEETTHVDPWVADAETIVLIHGMAESTRAFTAWIPYLSRQLRVITVDLPGFGRSMVDFDAYPWSADSFASDLVRLLDDCGIHRAHILGAKTGGAVALSLACRFPHRARSVISITGPMWATGGRRLTHQQDIAGRLREVGLERWADETMDARLGTEVSDAHRRWWVELTASSDPRALAATARGAMSLDLRDHLSAIEFPALMITAKGSPLSDENALGHWHRAIPHGVSVVFPDDAYHIAAIRPDDCAALSASFLGHADRSFDEVVARLDDVTVRGA